MNLNNKKKLYLYFGTGIAIMVIIIVIILVIGLMSGGKLSYDALETKINKIALSYALDRPDTLPVKGEESLINYEDLVNAKKIKPLNEMLKDENASCTATIKIKNNNEHYLATTILDCNDKYKTKTLTKTILENEKIVDEGYGLYLMNNEYVYRGEDVNNYVRFNDKLWRIIKITSEGDIRLIELDRDDTYAWDDRYNSERDSDTGINNYVVSRIKDTINDIYNNEFKDNIKSYISNQTICLDKEDRNDAISTASCNNILSDQYISLPRADEFVIPSIDKGCTTLTASECKNYNYMTNFKKTLWSITADSYKSDKVYKMASNIISGTTSSSSSIRVVIHLDKDVTITKGDGSQSNPYIIKTAN